MGGKQLASKAAAPAQPSTSAPLRAAAQGRHRSPRRCHHRAARPLGRARARRPQARRRLRAELIRLEAAASRPRSGPRRITTAFPPHTCLQRTASAALPAGARSRGSSFPQPRPQRLPESPPLGDVPTASAPMPARLSPDVPIEGESAASMSSSFAGPHRNCLHARGSCRKPKKPLKVPKPAP